MRNIRILDENYSTTRLCYKLLDDKFLDKNKKIKEEYKFKLNFPEFGIIDSKIPAKEDEKFDTYLFLPEGERRKGEGGLRTKGYFKFSYEKKNDKWYLVEDYELIKEIDLDENLVKDYEELPLITIITIVYNGEKYLEETIQSVINQTYPNVEYIIIDGDSEDKSVEVIKKYQNNISYWVSEKDKGLYDAMNKGARLANGDFVIFLNAGDTFVNKNSLENVVKKIKEKNKVYFTRAKVVGKNKTWIYPSFNKNIDKWIKNYLPNHQAMLFPKIFYKNYKYDLKLKITADIDYKLSAKKYGYKFINEIIVVFELGGVSTKCYNLKETLDKIKELIYRDFYKNFRLKGCIDVLKTITKSVVCNIFGEDFLFVLIKKIKGYK